MIERKIRMKKDNVEKEITENLVSIYLNMGWTKVNGKKEILEDEMPKKFLKGNK